MKASEKRAKIELVLDMLVPKNILDQGKTGSYAEAKLMHRWLEREVPPPKASGSGS